MSRVLARAFVCVWIGAVVACGAEPPQPPPALRGSELAIERRGDGLEQISLRGRPQHVTVARVAADGGLEHTCEHARRETAR